MFYLTRSKYKLPCLSHGAMSAVIARNNQQTIIADLIGKIKNKIFSSLWVHYFWINILLPATEVIVRSCSLKNAFFMNTSFIEHSEWLLLQQNNSICICRVCHELEKVEAFNEIKLTKNVIHQLPCDIR